MIKSRTQGLLRTLALLAVVTFAGACSQGQDSSILNRGVGAEPESLDPHHARTTQAHTVQRDLFEGLTAYSADGQLIPAAAERWEISDDGLTYTFWLRPDARWSNGEPLTAEDFVYSFRRLMNPATAAFYAEHLIAIENAAAIVAGEEEPEALGARAVTQRQLVLQLEYPVPYFIGLLALPSASPVYAPSIEEHGERFARAGNLVSNGAYRLDAWELGAFIELSRNPHYWDNANTAISKVRFHVTVEPAAELNRYRAGELDVTATVPSEAYAQVARDRPDELRVAPFLSTYFYGLNLSKPKLRENLDLRRALSMAIDREVLTEKVTARGERPAYSWVPPGVLNYEPARFGYADLPREERHEMARRSYAAAGYGPDQPLAIEIRYNSAETHERIALAIQAMWRDVLGFEAKLVNEEFRVLVANIRERSETEVFRLSWNGDYNDANSFLSMFESDNPSNLTAYSNPSFDALMKSAAQQTEPLRRRMYLEEAEHVMLDDHPVVPLYFHVSKHLVRREIRGWQDNVLDFHYSQHLSFSETNED
ncbi:MAG: peptide ABC transporter substrate-binding protein [Woeseia sp.]|nr:peptide ABC transporter substrate-binding protein [Woeseia sp.]MBT8097407.1 peptide ABC transporter substrate-binding protein [Woeseia sp.]NNL53852.1 peptide ABC transporter substrate-binding protein [Woeseia sp.]